ncbi:MAG: serine/threonine-protein kinase [Candidatus Obscuribacterales bacterium]
MTDQKSPSPEDKEQGLLEKEEKMRLVEDRDPMALEDARRRVGTLFEDKYQIEECVGQGGMSVVYRARHVQLNKTVAVKLLHSHLSEQSKAIGRFHQEAQAISRLDHDGFVRLYDYGATADGVQYLVLEYLTGSWLSNLLKDKGPLGPQATIDLMMQLCQALSHAHARGIVHRDLKPSNIAIIDSADGTRRTKIADFGIARVAGEDVDKLNLTQTGDVFGSPPYMSPEQWQGKKPDGRSDIYSLGCVMFECLTGDPPFMGTSYFETMKAHLELDVPKIPRSHKDFANYDALEVVLAKMLAKDPKDRFSSVDELTGAFETLKSQSADSIKDLTRAHRIKKARRPKWWRQPLEILIWIGVIGTGTLIFDKLADTWKGHDEAGLRMLNTLRYEDAYAEFGKAAACAQKDMKADQIRNALEKQALVAFILDDQTRLSALQERLSAYEAKAGEKDDTEDWSIATDVFGMTANVGFDVLYDRVYRIATGKIASDDLEGATTFLTKVIASLKGAYGQDDVRVLEPVTLLARALIMQCQEAPPGSPERAELTDSIAPVTEEGLRVARLAAHAVEGVAASKDDDSKSYDSKSDTSKSDSLKSGDSNSTDSKADDTRFDNSKSESRYEEEVPLNEVRCLLYTAYVAAIRGDRNGAGEILGRFEELQSKRGIKLDAYDLSIAGDAYKTIGKGDVAVQRYEEAAGLARERGGSTSVLQRTIKLMVATSLEDLKDPAKAEEFVEKHLVLASAEGNPQPDVIAECHSLLSWIAAVEGKGDEASHELEEAVRVTQTTLPSEHWYRSPVFQSAAEGYIHQGVSISLVRATSFLQQKVASVDCFKHKRDYDYFRANDTLASALIANDKEPEARARFSIDVERVLSTPVSQMVQITPEFAPLSARCVVDTQTRTRLVERIGKSLDVARARWTEHQDDVASKGLEARIFSDQLVGYGLVAVELGHRKEGLASIEEALRLADSGLLDSPQVAKIKSCHEFVLKEMEMGTSGAGKGSRNASGGKEEKR